MIDLLWIAVFTAFSAAWFIASGYLSYAWSNGDDRTRMRFHGLMLALYFLAAYLLFQW